MYDCYSFVNTDQREPDEIAIVDLMMNELMSDPAIAAQIEKEEAKYTEALLNRPFNPDDDF